MITNAPPNPLRLAYVTNTAVPSTKANTKQAFAMCAAFANQHVRLTLLHPDRHATAPLPGVDPFEFYGVPRAFDTQKVPCIDSGLLARVRPPWWFALMRYSFARALVRALAHQPVDAIYTRDAGTLPSLARARQRGRLRVPIVFEVHKVYPQIRPFLPQVAALVVINDFLRQTYITDFGFAPDRIRVAHDGFEPREYADQPAYRYQPKASCRVVYTGNLFRWKGVYTLVDSLRHLPEHVTLQIVGGSAETLPPFEQYVARQPWANRVELSGFMTPTDIPAVLSAADVLVLPNSARDPLSRSTSPMKLFEYMAARRPLVASRLPALQEVLCDGHNALLCAPDDPRDLAEKIRAAVAEDQSALVEQAWADVQQYAWPVRARRICEFLATRGIGSGRSAAAANPPVAAEQGVS